MSSAATLDDLRTQFACRRYLAMPIAGAIGWSAAGAAGVFLRPGAAALAMFFCVGFILFLGLGIARLLGEELGKSEKTKELDRLFLLTVLMASLTWGIAIPFFQKDPTSLPLTLGILSGMMWVPFSWMMRHWIGLVHGIARTGLVVAAWYVFPEQRFVVIPGVIVAIYLFTIAVLATRKLP
ncbi:MAG: hypothetical protein HYS13_00595 [Planctomycetia bacterium]|nr:hypothetical protein [Planctomycetia bacterium]